jgi:transposase-like protein
MSTFKHPMFTDENAAREALEAIRWPNGSVCVHCGGTEQISRVAGEKQSHRPGLLYCNDCKGQFTVTVGTVFERSKIPLTKWWMATHLLCSSKKGISSHQIHRILGVTYKTAWFMTHRIRDAMKDGFLTPVGGSGKTVEADETYLSKSPKTRKPAGLPLNAKPAPMDHCRRPPLRDRHVQRRQNQLRAQMRLHRPTDNASRVHIEHHRQIQKARPSWDKRDVGNPQPIRAFGVELSLDQINLGPRSRIAHSRHYVAPQRRSTKACRSHQPRNPFATDPYPILFGELGMNVRRSINALGAPVDRLDLRHQCQVPTFSITHRSIQPCVKRTSRNLQQSAHHPDRVGGLVRLHEPEERFEVPLSVANQAAAFERISRSSLSLRFSRRNRDNSSRSGVVRPPSALPPSRCACLTHNEIDQAVGPNSFASNAGLRPLRTKSTICRLNSGVYRTPFSAISNTSIANIGVSTKTGQLQFATKIDMAFANGLISRNAFLDLVRLKDIRNDFAHHLNIKNFNSQSIRDSAANFILINDYVAETELDSEGKMIFANLAFDAKPAIHALHANQRKKNPRERYVMTAQLLTIRFAPCDLINYPLPFI